MKLDGQSQEAILSSHGPKLDVIANVALDCLWRWASFAERYWWEPGGQPGIGCFGTGYSDNWAVQTNTKYAGAMSVLATTPCRGDLHGFSPDQALARALAALRFCLSTHASGDRYCADGQHWGHTWISGLAIERMMHGVDRLWSLLTSEDQQRLLAVLADEADYLCTDYSRDHYKDVQAGLWHNKGPNHPESNIWNGAICARAALYQPGHPRAAQWLERAHLFWLNGISIPADASDSTLIEGRPLRDWHRGANFFPHYALDHHGYMNVGYMVICLSNIAMIHYAYVLRGCEAPRTLYHHAHDLWALVRRLFFADGRLLRIGGDSRIRYCYCQDYVIPMLVFAADYWQDPHAPDLLAAAVNLARREQSLSSDGRFLSSRLQDLAHKAPYYYTRIESDRAVALSQAADWLERRVLRPTPVTVDYETSVAGGWVEAEHGDVFHRSATRFASWSWLACENPQGLCLPPDNGDFAEWQENLAGRVHGLGHDSRCHIKCWAIESFAGGFLTTGTFFARSMAEIREGWNAETAATAEHHIAFAALPDGHTVIRLELARLLLRRVFLAGWEGVKLEIPNDVLNGGRRHYGCASGQLVLAAYQGPPQIICLDSLWASIEDRIGLVGIYGANAWHILQRGRRIGGHAIGNILTDTFCFQICTSPCDIQGPAIVLDNGCAILSSVDAAGTRRLCEGGVRVLACHTDDFTSVANGCRAVKVRGQNGRDYILVANFGPDDVEVILETDGEVWQDLVTDGEVRADSGLRLFLNIGQGRLLASVTSR